MMISQTLIHADYILIIEINKNGEFNKKKISIETLRNKAKIPNYVMDSSFDELMTCFDNYILYNNTENDLYIYDYVNDLSVINCKFIGYGMIDSFVKVNNEPENKKTIKKKIINYENDIKIKLNDGIYNASKDLLLLMSEYFVSILSGKYSDEILEFDIKYDIFDQAIKFINDDKINMVNINMLLDLYKFSDFIMYNELKEYIHEILFNKYKLDDDLTKIKIYDIESLQYLPKSIKEIKFCRDLNEDINNKIPNGIEKIIFGGKFKKQVLFLPKSTIKLEFGKMWNNDIKFLPYFVEEIILGKDFDKEITEVPLNLKILDLHIDYKRKKKNEYKKLKNIEIKYRSIGFEKKEEKDDKEEK